jgi:drug/metabolite transporter (DMT)-like permease
MTGIVDILSLVLVGAFWGCTNPLLRKGSTEANDYSSSSSSAPVKQKQASPETVAQKVAFSLARFRHVRVWLPYLLNQAGSLLYYFTLSQSDLSLAVPICNGLSLVFSIVTTYLIGEKVDQPVRTAAGAALVVTGVALCLLSKE